MAANFTFEALEEKLQRVRTSSAEGLTKQLSYTPHHFTDEEKVQLLRFWSNHDQPVFTAKHQGILSGCFVSKESRIIDDLRTTSLKILNLSPEIREALGTLAIPDALSILGKEFYGRVFGEYGDDSVAQLVPGTVAFEGMSFLYSMQVSHHRFIPKIGKSSRYRDFSRKGSDGNYQYLIDPFVREAGMEPEFRETADALFRLYESFASKEGEGRNELLEQLKDALPYDAFREGVQKDLENLGLKDAGDAELQKAYEKTLVPMRLDAARHILPLATISATAALLNGQSARDLLLRGYTAPRGESLIFTELLRRELEPAFGPLLLDVDPQPEHAEQEKREKKRERSREWRQFLYGQGRAHELSALPTGIITLPAAEKSFADDEFPGYIVEQHEPFHRILDPKTGVEVEIATDDDLSDLAAAILREGNAHMTLGQAKYAAAAKSLGEQKELVLNYAATELRRNRRHKPGRAFERVNFEISIKGITVGELRDLRRHRTQTNLEPPYFSPLQDFYLAPALLRTAAGDLVREKYGQATALYSLLAEEINPETAQTILPLATKVTANMQVNLRQAHHFIELRTQPGAHGNYLRICQMLYVGMKHEFPLVRETMTYVNKKTEIDYGRAVQEIRAMRKGK